MGKQIDEGMTKKLRPGAVIFNPIKNEVHVIEIMQGEFLSLSPEANKYIAVIVSFADLIKDKWELM